MNPMFVRFGLPWLIFGSAVFALHWNIWHDESEASFTPTEDSVKHVSRAQSIGRSHNLSIDKSHHVAVQSNSQPVSSSPVTSINTAVAAPKQLTLAPVLPNVGMPERVTTNQAPLIGANNIYFALQDADPNSRYQALQESDAQGIVVSAHVLHQMATSDRDSRVRIMAMTKFAQDAEMDPSMVRAVAEAGLRDGDAMVSAHARDMLEQLDSESRSNDEVQPSLPPDEVVQ